MSCYKPNYIVTQFIDGKRWRELLFDQEHGRKLDFKVSKQKNQLYRFMNHDTFRDFFISEKEMNKDLPDNVMPYEVKPVPCGCCIGCRLDYSIQWATRCILEAEQYEHNYFITLTYDDNHLVYGKRGNATLVPDDLTLFIKRLRTYFKREYNNDNIRFFACGEYGDHSFRPHYHIIAFNINIPDLTPHFVYEEDGKTIYTKHVQNGNIYYYSDVIHKLWNKGNILIGECSFQSCAYVARYVVKKQKGNTEHVYKLLDVVPEFVRMSRKPGIACNYFKDNLDEIAEYDGIVVPDTRGSRFVCPPRYYSKLLEAENELSYYVLKFNRNLRNENYLNTISNQTTLHYDDYLEVLEERKELQISSLQRTI